MLPVFMPIALRRATELLRSSADWRGLQFDLVGISIYVDHCLGCGRFWPVGDNQKTFPVCPDCHKSLAQSDEKTSQELLSKILRNAGFAVETAQKCAQCYKDECARTEALQRHPLLRLLNRINGKDSLETLRREVAQAERWILSSKLRFQMSGNLPERVQADRRRFQNRQLAVRQRKLAETEREKALQEQRIDRFLNLNTELHIDRESLVIRRKDYKRGNPIENFVRSKWRHVINETFDGKCFVCGGREDLALDHLWMPKNEGGNFVMCVSNGSVLKSNVLVLCRSCNSIKGEESIQSIIPSDKVLKLIEIQQILSERMMEDAKLRRVAGTWYGKRIDPL